MVIHNRSQRMPHLKGRFLQSFRTQGLLDQGYLCLARQRLLDARLPPPGRSTAPPPRRARSGGGSPPGPGARGCALAAWPLAGGRGGRVPVPALLVRRARERRSDGRQRGALPLASRRRSVHHTRTVRGAPAPVSSLPRDSRPFHLRSGFLGQLAANRP